jgi:hypothetical protein
MKNFWYIFAGFNVLLFTSVIVAFAVLSRRKRDHQTGTLTPEEQMQRWKARAPGWQIRCLKCDFTEPYGKYGIRMRAAGRKYTFGYCSHCRGIRFYVIEHERAA